MHPIKQLLRRPGRTIAGILLIAMVTMLLCVSVGQAQAAGRTAKAVDELYTTVAIPTMECLKEWVEIMGMYGYGVRMPEEIMAWAERMAEEHPELVKGIAQPGLASAYIPALEPLSYMEHGDYYEPTNVLGASSGRLMQTSPYGAPYTTAVLEVQIGSVVGELDRLKYNDVFQRSGFSKVLDDGQAVVEVRGTVQSAPGLWEAYPDPVGRDIRLYVAAPDRASFDSLGLEPGTRVLAYGMNYFDEDWGLCRLLSQRQKTEITRISSSEYKTLFDNEKPMAYAVAMTVRDRCALEGLDPIYATPTIALLDGSVEEFLQSDAGQPWREALERVEVNDHAFPVIGVEKLGAVAEFARQNAWIEEGRDFTREELYSGAKVCVVSSVLAAANGIRVGDAIPVRYYNADPGSGFQSTLASGRGVINPGAYFYTAATPFAGEAETYTVVGLYGQLNGWADPMDNIYAFTPNTIFVPEASVTGTMDRGNFGMFYTLVLQNGSVSDFDLLAVEDGCDRYFFYYDQGYSEIAGSLFDYRAVARTALAVGGALGGMLLLLYLAIFSLTQRETLRKMQLLGTPKGPLLAFSLAEHAGVLVPGAALGAILSVFVWDAVSGLVLPEETGITAAAMDPLATLAVAAATVAATLLPALLITLLLCRETTLLKRR